MASIPAIAISDATPFMNLNWSICPFITGRLKKFVRKEFVKAMYIDEPDILDAAIAKIPKEFKDRFTMVKSAPFYLEILGKTTNKGAAVLHLAERLGIQQEETMAIGDEENDRSMLEVVGHAVVMENGNPTLKKITTYYQIK